MGLFLKNADGLYFKEIDSANSDIIFTPHRAEAKNYNGGEWFADTELEYVKFHFKDRPEVKTLATHYD